MSRRIPIEVQEDNVFRDALIESYGTREALADELRERIDEVLELRKELEREQERRAPRALQQRIKELERNLCMVNDRLTKERSAEMMLRRIVSPLRSEEPAPPTDAQFNFALGLLDSARKELTPIPGETAALCRAIDDFLRTGIVPSNCEGLADEEHVRGRSDVLNQLHAPKEG